MSDATLTLTDGMVIRSDTTLPAGVHVLPKGLIIDADGVTLDGNGALLIGHDRNGAGITVNGHENVSIRNVRIRDYHHGINAANCRKLTLDHNHITSTGETPANTIFLNIWLAANEAYGGAILLDHVDDSDVADNDIQHQMCGLLTYHCNKLTVSRNLANYNSGYGLHLFNTCDSLFVGNWADYCCRYEPRGPGFGHMGADATGFLIVHNSCRNVFKNNMARLGGDGFFLAGLKDGGERVPCNDNLFEGNDGSHSPNIAFEATFSSGNIFRNNKADRCNYGFWHGFSRDHVIENNSMVMNRQAGIAVENGTGFHVRGNQFQRNGVGLLLWSKYEEPLATNVPGQRTVHDWKIEGNTFTRNGTGIYIGADRDHGIRPMPEESRNKPGSRPHDNAIHNNDIQDNRIGIDLSRTDRTHIEGNTINRNVECNVRQDDAKDTVLRNNLGMAGGYL